MTRVTVLVSGSADPGMVFFIALAVISASEPRKAEHGGC